MLRSLSWRQVCLLAVVLFLIAYYQLRDLKIQGRDYVSTLREVPITIPLAIDALDLALDFMGVPFLWIILNRLRLQGLQAVSILESLVPGTQFLPVLTISWLAVRGYDWFRQRQQRL